MVSQGVVINMFGSVYDDTPYAWVILKDKLEDCHKTHEIGIKCSACDFGTAGPSQASQEEIAKAWTSGRDFRMKDDDGNTYYYGKIWTNPEDEGSETDFGPLDDFGMPNAGAVTIQYKVNGSWQSL